MTALLARIDAFLQRIVIVAQLTIFAALIVVMVQALDREPPFHLLSVEPAAAKPGETVRLRMAVTRDITRPCSASFSRYVVDSEATRYFLDASQASRKLIEAIELRTPGRLDVAFKVPDASAIGPATLITSLEYTCNKVHYLWPIEVTMTAPFEVLPP